MMSTNPILYGQVSCHRNYVGRRKCITHTIILTCRKELAVFSMTNHSNSGAAARPPTEKIYTSPASTHTVKMYISQQSCILIKGKIKHISQRTHPLLSIVAKIQNYYVCNDHLSRLVNMLHIHMIAGVKQIYETDLRPPIDCSYLPTCFAF